jgi:hypothetical protein
MIKATQILPIVAGLALLTVPALAEPISGILSITGSDKYSNSLDTISFDGGTGEVGGTSTGSLAVFTNTTPVQMYDFSFGTGFTPGTEVFSATEAGTTVAFSLLSETSAITSNGLDINGIGTLTETGYSSTPATFTLTTQNGGQDINDVSFSATTTATPTPEPASMTLLGTGLLSRVGLARRKFAK